MSQSKALKKTNTFSITNINISIVGYLILSVNYNIEEWELILLHWVFDLFSPKSLKKDSKYISWVNVKADVTNSWLMESWQKSYVCVPCMAKPKQKIQIQQWLCTALNINKHCAENAWSHVCNPDMCKLHQVQRFTTPPVQGIFEGNWGILWHFTDVH